MAKNLNYSTRLTSRQLQSNVIVIWIDGITNAEMQRVRQLIGSHFIFAYKHWRDRSWRVCARPLRGFTMSESIDAYRHLVSDYTASVIPYTCMFPDPSSVQKGGLSC